MSIRDTESRSLEMWRLLSECDCAVAGGANSLAMRRPPSGCEPVGAELCTHFGWHAVCAVPMKPQTVYHLHAVLGILRVSLVM